MGEKLAQVLAFPQLDEEQKDELIPSSGLPTKVEVFPGFSPLGVFHKFLWVPYVSASTGRQLQQGAEGFPRGLGPLLGGFRSVTRPWLPMIQTLINL